MKDQTEAYRHVPYDIEVEQALLGALLLDNRRIDEAAAELEPEHFYDPLHARLFDMICYLPSEETAPSPLTVHAVMKTDPGLIEVGGHAYLSGLAASTPAMPNVLDYARILRDLAARRALIRIGENLVNGAFEPPRDLSPETLGSQTIEDILQAGSGSAKPILSPYKIAMESVRALEEVAAGKAIPGIKTGIAKLDREIGVLRGGDFITILGKSGMGKSALMGTLAKNIAQQGHPVIFFSLEMTASQLVERMVCDIDFDTAEKAMWYSRVRNHRLSDDEFARFMLTSRKLESLPLEIIEEDGLTMAQIAARSRAFSARHGRKNVDGSPKIGAVLLDYLQIIEPADSRDNRERQVARVARAAKALAKRLGWPVIAGSQMNESDEGRAKEERRPRASDARESKGIMNESDLMFSPYRPVVAVENRKPMEAAEGDPANVAWKGEVKALRHRFDLLCLKNRHGRKFDLELWADMAANAIRDQTPSRAMTPQDDAMGDLLENLV